MTAKDYVKIAKAFEEAKPTGKTMEEAAQWVSDTEAIANVCAADNTRFDRKRFFTACGRNV